MSFETSRIEARKAVSEFAEKLQRIIEERSTAYESAAESARRRWPGELGRSAARNDQIKADIWREFAALIREATP